MNGSEKEESRENRTYYCFARTLKEVGKTDGSPLGIRTFTYQVPMHGSVKCVAARHVIYTK